MTHGFFFGQISPPEAQNQKVLAPKASQFGNFPAKIATRRVQNGSKRRTGLIYRHIAASLQGMNVQNPTPLHGRQRLPEKTVFDRSELALIMTLYGRMVAAGKWRDYGMSFLRDVAIFSVFRHTAEHPLYRIEKRPKLRQKQGLYAVIGMDGQILKRGHDLKNVLRVLERKLIRTVE